MSPKFTFRTHVRIPVSCFVDYVGDGLIGMGVVQDFSVDGWRISGEQPARVGMDLALRVMLPREPAPIAVEAATVQWGRGREFGIHIGARRLKPVSDDGLNPCSNQAASSNGTLFSSIASRLIPG